MKRATLIAFAIFLSGNYALAAQKALNDTECQKVWVEAVQSNDSLSAVGAAPYIVVFKEVDVDGNGQISNSEFKEGCKKGLVHEKSASN
jgi:hypothetical protein